MEQGFVDSKVEETVAVAASVLDRAKWINKMPKMKTDKDLLEEQLQQAKNKISGILARK